MADFQIPNKTLETSIDRATDSFLVYDNSASALRRTVINNMLNITGAPVGSTDIQTLTNKTLTAPTISSPVLSGTLSGTYTIGGTPTFPSSVVTLTGSQTLTNKVLTSPTINTATIANPTLTTDTVSEFTSAAGVTIDGVLLKDSKMNGSYITDATVDTAQLKDDSVTSAKLVGVDKSNLTTDSNPYKFRARRVAAFTTSTAAFKIINFDTEDFDTNNNFDTTTNIGRYTVPVSGFYQINGRVSVNGITQSLVALYKNGSIYQRGTHQNVNAVVGNNYSDIVQLTAGDYIELAVYTDNANNIETATGTQAYFTGALVSRT